jgi:cell division protein FtsB
VGPINGYLHQRGELDDQRTALAGLKRQRTDLKRQLSALAQPDVLEARARALGLIKPGEKPFIIKGVDPPAPVPRRSEPGLLDWLLG